MSSTDTYIANLADPHKQIAEKLRSIITSFPELKEEFKWSMPVYTHTGTDVAYLKATKAGVNFGLNRGAHIKDPQGLLEGTGADMRHIKFSASEQIDASYLSQLLRLAIEQT